MENLHHMFMLLCIETDRKSIQTNYRVVFKENIELFAFDDLNSTPHYIASSNSTERGKDRRTWAIKLFVSILHISFVVFQRKMKILSRTVCNFRRKYFNSFALGKYEQFRFFSQNSASICLRKNSRKKLSENWAKQLMRNKVTLSRWKNPKILRKKTRK